MAHIYKRGKTWSYSVHNNNYLYNKLKKKITKGGFKTKREAELAANKVELELHNNNYFESTKKTFSHIADLWYAYYEQTSKISSVRARKRPLEILNNEFGDYPIKNLNKNIYHSFLLKLSEQYSYNYLDSIHTTANLIIKYAMYLNLLDNNILEGVRIPKKQKTLDDIEADDELGEFLELEELKLFLETTKENGLYLDYIIFATLAFTGLRIGELLTLKWSDINFVNRTISVTKTYYNPNNNKMNFTMLPPKTKSSIRTIKVDLNLINLHKKHYQEQLELKKHFGDLYKDQNFVFAEDNGYPPVFTKVGSRLSRLLNITKIDKAITAHSFRHTHASLLIEADANIKEIQHRLGHSDIATTMNVYAHVTKTVEEKTSDKFSKLTKGLLN
ncbi:site-specific integrase [Amphibacillus sp. MSJ-3]|uniref:site-specific integrase n=1 Tax=Amphibacillus sp. MSJ-3 TaxID=2841505 RepID=UPI001C0F0872|nr:site-specific integrase [Amphibacillus sp. MSJ-3]MBU5595341.1 site-specific integrase [Amphibacillus sp. MSJ-3]